jgi:hypothetical protein
MKNSSQICISPARVSAARVAANNNDIPWVIRISLK